MAAELPTDTALVNGLSAARPPLIRAMNEQLLLERIRLSGPYSRADLARVSGLSKPTVSLALATNPVPPTAATSVKDNRNETHNRGRSRGAARRRGRRL